jgi:hypothetical protein
LSSGGVQSERREAIRLDGKTQTDVVSAFRRTVRNRRSLFQSATFRAQQFARLVLAIGSR